MFQCPNKDCRDYGYEVSPRSRRDLIQLAHGLHRLMEYRGKGAFPLMEFLERVLVALVPGFAFEVLTEEEIKKQAGDVLAATFPLGCLILIREDVYDAACSGHGFARMIVAHEIGHLFLHRRESCLFAFREAGEFTPAFRCSEWQANAFAGALLMPAHEILNLSPGEIRDKYEVSKAAAETQLKAIKKEVKKWQLPIL